MKRFLAIACLALASLLPLQSSTHAAAPSGLKTGGTLTFGTNFGYAPMEMYAGPNANIETGADIEIGHALAAKMGLKATFVNITDFGTLIVGLQSRRYDAVIAAMNITPQRARTVNFIRYFIAGQSIVVAKGNPKHIQTLADLSGQAVAAQSGTTEIDAVLTENALLKKAGKPEITLKQFSLDPVALQQVTLGRVVAELTDYPVAAYDCTQFPTRYEIAGKQFGAYPDGIAVRKTDPSIQSGITAALKAIRADGEYMAILKKYHLEQGAI